MEIQGCSSENCKCFSSCCVGSNPDYPPCAKNAMESGTNSLQQLKAEIHRLAEKWRNSNMTTAQLVIELDRLSGELSAV